MKKETSGKLTTRINKEAKDLLAIIKDEDKKITPRYILEEFVRDYCEATPKGNKFKIKEIEKEIKKIENKIYKLHEDKTKLEIELKTRKDKLNKTLDSYIDENLNNAVKSIIKTYNQQKYTSFEDIPKQTFILVAKNYKIDCKILKNEVRKKF